MKTSPKANALSIDLEEWYHPYLIKKHVNSAKLDSIQEPTDALLTLLNKYETKATFFIVGEVAVKYPELIKKIHKSGHEIASHGFSHRTLHELGPSGLEMELSKFKRVIYNILGDIEIKGFRAPTFSLTKSTKWAVGILKAHDFKYDSSIFPIRINPHIGVKRAPLDIYGLDIDDITLDNFTSSLKEFPISVFEVLGFRFPVLGGFYSRLIPVSLQKKFLRWINKDRPSIVYIHPWECNKATPRIKLGILSSFVSYYNIDRSLAKLECLLQNFHFGRIDNILGV